MTKILSAAKAGDFKACSADNELIATITEIAKIDRLFMICWSGRLRGEVSYVTGWDNLNEIVSIVAKFMAKE